MCLCEREKECVRCKGPWALVLSVHDTLTNPIGGVINSGGRYNTANSKPASTASPAPLQPYARAPVQYSALPELYGGDCAGCRTFLLACELYRAEFLELRQRISTVVQRVTGRTLEWASAIWRKGGAPTMDYGAFLKAVFDYPDQCILKLC